MRSGGKIFIIAGVGLGLVAVLLAVLAATSGGGSKGKQEDDTTAVIVEASVDIPASQILTADVLEVREVPQDQVNADSVTSIGEAVSLMYRSNLVAGQPLYRSGLQQPGLATNIEPGKRAYSLPVTEANALSGLIADGDYIDVVFKARINEVRLLGTSLWEVPEDGPGYEFQVQQIPWTSPDVDNPQFPAAGAPGSEFYIRDGVGDEQQLEPVAKVLLQDLKVIRVVRPGEVFSANGQRVDEAAAEDATSGGSAEEPTGYLILEVTDQQAEILAFIQDERHTYQVMVRAKDDHTVVNTTGVTFQMLYEDPEYALPMPAPVTAGANGRPLLPADAK